MANTHIKFLRGIGFPSSGYTATGGAYAWAANNSGSISVAEPWVNTNTKQLWIDNRCINPTLTEDSNYLSLATTISNTNEVITTLSLDYQSLHDDILGDVTIPSAYPLKFKNTSDTATGTAANVTYDYAPHTSGTYEIKFGSGLTFNATTGVVQADLIESFLSGVTIQQGDGSTNMPDTTHKYMVFTFTTNGSPAPTTIYVDAADFYDDTDTQTDFQNTTGNPVQTSWTTNSSTFTVGAYNKFNTVHSAITAPAYEIASNQSPSFGETFTIISGVTEDGFGHVTGLKTKTVTLPTPADIPEVLQYSLIGDHSGSQVAGSHPANNEANWKLYENNALKDVVTLKHADWTSSVGSMITFNSTHTSSGSNDTTVITAHITIIDGGTFTNS